MKKDIGQIIKKLSAIKRITALGDMKARNPFKVLIATILSQRTKDENTMKVSAQLFKAYPDAHSLANAKVHDVEKLIKSSGFYKTKAGRIIEVSRIIDEDYKGVVPREMEKLLELPGVGRKTANCVLVYAFHIPAIPVDTHVNRIANRLGLVKTKTPEKTEEAMTKKYDRKYWRAINDLFVSFGKQVCRPIGPRCEICPITGQCDYFKQKFSRVSAVKSA